MKKILCVVACCCSLTSLLAQTDSSRIVLDTLAQTPQKKSWTKIDLSNRSNDHLMMQYGFDSWTGNPDSINPQGFSRHFNVYMMLDKPFKTNPQFSVGLGVGVGTSNMFFKNTYVDVKSNSTRLPFSNRDSADRFKKFKLATIFLEAPIELRYSSNPDNNNKSIKAALGIKVGTLVDAHTKGKNLENKGGQSLNNYIQKEKAKKFFNTTRLAATARFGYGILSIYGAYQVTTLLKDGAGPDIRPFSVGIAISGL